MTERMKISPVGRELSEGLGLLCLPEPLRLPFSWASHHHIYHVQFVCVESLVTAVVDMYPKVFRRGYRRELLILALSIVSYFLGLVMLTEVSGVDRESNMDCTAQGEVPGHWVRKV